MEGTDIASRDYVIYELPIGLPSSLLPDSPPYAGAYDPPKCPVQPKRADPILRVRSICGPWTTTLYTVTISPAFPPLRRVSSQPPTVQVWTSDYCAVDRLPTVSASQVLDGIGNHAPDCIQSGIELIDAVLSDNIQFGPDSSRSRAGVKRGQVTDVWGPPGSGKAAFGIQLAANTLCNGEGVVWVGSSAHPHPVGISRAKNSPHRLLSCCFRASLRPGAGQR
jgi:hypothetical protein